MSAFITEIRNLPVRQLVKQQHFWAFTLRTPFEHDVGIQNQRLFIAIQIQHLVALKWCAQNDVIGFEVGIVAHKGMHGDFEEVPVLLHLAGFN